MLQHSVHIERVERLRTTPQRIMTHILMRTTVPRSKQVCPWDTHTDTCDACMRHWGVRVCWGFERVRTEGNNEMNPVLLLNWTWTENFFYLIFECLKICLNFFSDYVIWEWNIVVFYFHLQLFLYTDIRLAHFFANYQSRLAAVYIRLAAFTCLCMKWMN